MLEIGVGVEWGVGGVREGRVTGKGNIQEQEDSRKRQENEKEQKEEEERKKRKEGLGRNAPFLYGTRILGSVKATAVKKVGAVGGKVC